MLDLRRPLLLSHVGFAITQLLDVSRAELREDKESNKQDYFGLVAPSLIVPLLQPGKPPATIACLSAPDLPLRSACLCFVGSDDTCNYSRSSLKTYIDLV